MRVHRKNHHGKRIPPLLVFFLTIGLTAVVAYGSALVWQSIEDSASASSGHSSGVASGIQPPSAPISNEPSTPSHSKSESSASEITPASSIVPELPPLPSEIEPVMEREEYPGALRASGKTVDKSYFDDAIFFGDSISTGIPLYQVMPNAKVVAFIGINTLNAATKEAIDTPDGRMTMLDAAKQYGDKKKVYIMLGGNSLGNSKEAFIDGYRAFVELVKEQYPNAVVYLQSMTPVTDYVGKTYPSVSNELINEYNLAIMDLAAEMRVYYLDVAAALVDEEGKLPAEASPVDGMHFEPLYYHKWFDYLKTHTVEEEQ